MKKILSVLLMLILLCSCSGTGTVKPKVDGITFSAEMTYYNEAYGFDGEILSDGTFKAVINSPEELKDLNITMTKEGVTVEYKGLSYTPVEGSMPFSSVLEKFYLAIRDIIQSDKTADTNGIFIGGEGTGKYKLTISPSGLPQKLEIPDERFSIKFYNVSIKEEAND